MNKINYQLELEKTLKTVSEEQYIKSLLLHSCCAPCSSYVLEYLSNYFKITLFYFNPNIAPEKEYLARVEEQKKLIHELPVKHKITFLEGRYQPKEFYDAVRGFESEKEGGTRCECCFRLRLREAAIAAKEGSFDYFTTTLTISPLKCAELLNQIGLEIAKEYQINYLTSDFKKKNGYQRSVVLSERYQLYRQNYCGCIFSKSEYNLTKNVPASKPNENR